MNEKLLKMLQGDASLYPHELEKQYLRVMNKIIELWHTSQATEYFRGLMMDERGGRQGFPQKVASEIFRLSQVHERIFAVNRGEAANPWAFVGERDMVERDMVERDMVERDMVERDMPAAGCNGCNVMPQEFLGSIESGDGSAVNNFVSQGADLNVRDERGRSALMICAANGNEEITRLLIQGGAHIQARDNAGYTPLHWAAFNDRANVARLLLENDSDPNVRSNFGWTPLMLAATRGHIASVKLLIAGGGNVNLADTNGWTALHKATANDYIEIVRILLVHFADRNMQLQDGRTALSIAIQNKNEGAISILNSLRLCC